jgi:sugar phosphate isomerase/epimerase
MKLSIRENMVPGASLLERFRALQRLGFDGIELTTSSRLECADEILAATRETRIQPSITSAMGGCLIDSRKEERDRAVRAHVEALELAARVGALGVISPPVITMKLQPDRPRIPDLSPVLSRDDIERQLVVALYREIASRGEELGTAIIIEPLNRYEQWWPCTLREAVELCDAVGSSACRMMADLFHMNIEERDLPAAIRETDVAYLYNVHLADSVRRLPATGHTDFKACFRALKEIGYDRYCGLECRVDGDPLTALSEAAGYLRRTWAEA